MEYDVVHLRLSVGSDYTWCGLSRDRCLTTLHVHDTDCLECIELLAEDDVAAWPDKSWAHVQDITSQQEIPGQLRLPFEPP